ncbi:gfo/Idh/MocA family oxidoreductase [Rhodospirillales bacterium]|nr:gfo/Idh/MocA family oxidoreductase [Rhodospirillales bacterium]
MKSLIVGYGSIGHRHADVLGKMGHNVAILSRRKIDHPQRFTTLDQALAEFMPEYVVIASRTIEHRDDIKQLSSLGFSGILMVEKPVYDTGSETIHGDFARIKVAFNLRFHPALQRFREIIGTRDVHAATAYVGSYLPDWRPETDYRQSYSADQHRGGGVLRDLSHELDYLTWIFGPWRVLTALGGHFSKLDIDSDDVFSVLYETEQIPSISLNINYLDTTTRREVIALTASGTVRLDMVAGTIEADGKIETFAVERNDTYIGQHKAMIDADDDIICDVSEGLDVMRMITAIENAANSKTWVYA